MTVALKTLKPLLIPLATLAALLLGPRAAAAAAPPPAAESDAAKSEGAKSDAPHPDAPNPDAKFAAAASAGNVKELKASGLAQGKALADDVKNFARRMAEDHAKANQELSVLIVKKGLKCSRGKESDTREALDSLASLTGAAFDKAYMALMVRDHRGAVSLYEAQSNEGQDPELKELAGKRLPMLKEHLEHAEEVAAKVGVKPDEKGPTSREARAP